MFWTKSDQLIAYIDMNSIYAADDVMMIAVSCTKATNSGLLLLLLAILC